jgi:hypothetical protein
MTQAGHPIHVRIRALSSLDVISDWAKCHLLPGRRAIVAIVGFPELGHLIGF